MNRQDLHRATGISTATLAKLGKGADVNTEILIASKILKKNGAIFISIDDNEFAQLKILCDDIFGYQNYIACFPWRNRDSIQNDTDMSINHEYILAY